MVYFVYCYAYKCPRCGRELFIVNPKWSWMNNAFTCSCGNIIRYSEYRYREKLYIDDDKTYWRLLNHRRYGGEVMPILRSEAAPKLRG